MSRENLSGSTVSSSHSMYLSSSSKPTQSRTPVKAKRPVLGERVDNYDHPTPRQHLVKTVKSVIRPRLSATRPSSAASSRTVSYQPSPTRASSHASSPHSFASSPAGANVSRPGNTPHPRRSSVALGHLINNEASMLFDTSRPDFLVDDTDESEADEEPETGTMVRRAVMGPGRLMTPANSQESQPNTQEHAYKEPSPRRLAMRLPTPPASQPGTDVDDSLSRTLIRPRPAPTPPRRSAAPSIRLNGSTAQFAQEISPNPRRKKSPKVGEAAHSRFRSPFELAVPSESTASPRHPRDRVEVVISRPRTSTPKTTPKATKGPRKSRLSTKTPSASHPLSHSTSSQPSRARRAPATAPPANRRKSIPAATRQRPSLPGTSVAKSKFAKTPRLSVPGRSRKSVTPAELKAMIGLMPEPVEQGSPSDDPLLLVGDDEDHFRKTPAIRPASRAGTSKSTGKSTARIIDFDAASAQGSARSNTQERTLDYEVPLHGSEAVYDTPQDYGLDSGGDSDNEDIGNDTFLHVASAGSRPTSATSLMDRLNEEQTKSTNDENPTRSRTPSPFLPATLMARDERIASPNASLQSRGDLDTSPSQSLSLIAAGVPSPVGPRPESPFLPASKDVEERAGSPALSAYSTGTPNDVADYRATSPLPIVDTVASSPTQSVAIAGWPSPAASLRSMASPQSRRSQSATPMAQDLTSRSSSVRVSSPAQVEMEHCNHPASSSPMGSPNFARSMTSTPRAHVTVLGEADDNVAGVTDSPGRSSIGMLSAASSPRSTRSRTATPAIRLDSSPGSAAQDPRSETGTASPYPRASALEEEVDEEQVQDSWSAGSPLLLPGTPSALGLFMPEEADGMSTPYSQAPICEARTPKPALAASPTHSRSTPASIAQDTPISYTRSPRRSPVVLPEVLAHEEDVEPTQGSEDKENLAPVFPSTTPVMSPPTLQASTPPFYAYTFSPRIASPLRITHNPAPSPSPKKLEKFTLFASKSPIPPIESLHDRFADEEVDDCPSADVTLEGNSADWSLSDEGALNEEGMEEALFQDEDSAEDLLDLETRSEGGEGLELESAGVEESKEQDDAVDGEAVENLHGAEPSQGTEVVVGEEEEEEQEEVFTDDCDAAAIEKVEEEEQGQDDDHLSDSTIAEASEQTQVLTTPTSDFEEKQPEESADEEEEEEGSVPPEEGSSSDTLADDAGFQSDTVLEDSLGKEVETGNSASPAPPPAAAPGPVPEKIILKLINRGIVKLEPEDDYVAAQQSTLAPAASTALEEIRSTTPAYEPPQFIMTAINTTAAEHPSPAPASSSTLYPDLPATPVFAPLSPLPSSTPLDSPPARQQISQSSQNIQSFENTFGGHAGPSTRPRSRLSRQIPDSPEEDEADSSIRVRAVQSLGDEMEDADNSMRSVVEVSSFDPKAAARAAAILKLNHAYIEHGDISKLGELADPASTRRRSMHSARLDKMDASRRDDKTELLYEAELEIVSTRRSRSRSMSRFRAVSEAATELPLPGAWNGTPQFKRKRAAPTEHYTEPPKTTPTWGVSQWKKLEKVFRAERDIWVTEREVKAMPGGFIGWARMSTLGPPAPTTKPWDPTRVVDRFLEEQKISLAEQVGDWSRDLLFTRVEALERHAEHRKMKDQAPVPEPSPKKARTDTPAKAPQPPSTVRKLFGWVLPGSTPKVSTTTASDASKKAPEPQSKEDGKGKEKASEGGGTFLNRLEAIQAQSPPRQMTQVLTNSVTRSHSTTQLDLAPQHPSSPAWKTAPVPAPSSHSRPTPRTLSAILAESSSSTTSGVNTSTNRLHSSLSQRSAALDALFSGTTSTTTKPAIGLSIKRSSSVKDMVRSFEDSGAFDKVLNKEKKV